MATQNNSEGKIPSVSSDEGLDFADGTELRDYEPPRVVAIANLRDILAGSGSTNPDGAHTGPTGQL